MPKQMYPTGYTITYHSTYSNIDVDCNWNLDCTQQDAPVAHSATAEKLGRVGGSVQVAASPDGSIAFLLFINQYASSAQAQAAVADLGSTMLTRDGVTEPTLALVGADGAVAVRAQGAISSAYIVAASQGAEEVEAAVAWERPQAAPWSLRQQLRQQVDWALKHPWVDTTS
jgi:hypothetical protein